MTSHKLGYTFRFKNESIHIWLAADIRFTMSVKYFFEHIVKYLGVEADKHSGTLTMQRYSIKRQICII